MQLQGTVLRVVQGQGAAGPAVLRSKCQVVSSRSEQGLGGHGPHPSVTEGFQGALGPRAFLSPPSVMPVPTMGSTHAGVGGSSTPLLPLLLPSSSLSPTSGPGNAIPEERQGWIPHRGARNGYLLMTSAHISGLPPYSSTMYPTPFHPHLHHHPGRK